LEAFVLRNFESTDEVVTSPFDPEEHPMIFGSTSIHVFSMLQYLTNNQRRQYLRTFLLPLQNHLGKSCALIPVIHSISQLWELKQQVNRTHPLFREAIWCTFALQISTKWTISSLHSYCILSKLRHLLLRLWVCYLTIHPKDTGNHGYSTNI